MGYLAIVAIAKNEASYIAEWLEFHRLVGVEHVYVYDNGSIDDTREILASYIKNGFVTCIPWTSFDLNGLPQYQAYAHALCNFGPYWRWLAFIDVDEFLFPLKADNLQTVLPAYDDLPVVGVHWHMFGSSGHKRRPAGLVIESYTKRAPIPSSIEEKRLSKWKSIVDPTKVQAVIGPHMFRLEDGRIGAYDESRRWVGKSQRASEASSILRLNHYFTKSDEELVAKIAKGSPCKLPNENAGPKLWATKRATVLEAEQVTDEAVLRFLVPLRDRMAFWSPD